MQSLPAEIGNLRNLQNLNLSYNQLQSLPAEIGNFCNLKILNLEKNKLQSLPVEILNIKNILFINHRSYDLTNLNIDGEILIFCYFNKELNNLPFNLKEIWLKSNIKNPNIKLPFGCMIKYY